MLDAAESLASEGSRSIGPETAKLIDDLTDEFVQIALAAADYYARKIARSLKLPPADLEDVRQDLLVEVLRRARSYDAGRAAPATFIELVTRHAADELASRQVAARQVVRRSVDDPVARADGSSAPFGDLLPEELGLAAFWAGCRDRFAAIERRIDVERFIQRLPDDLRCLCRLLQTERPTVAQRLSGLSVAEFYREIAELRMRLRAIGLGRGTP
jgi:RNA polymerase sigma-70 factor (ECF subfamily)